ncbi:DUF29 domain-containing protein [Synechococcus sp. PCC 7336]|uniref:DUF29 domain-containing protein n=1 Tax=Synechococcus sp. PCC 7336 TaxID=195250 RepID=UPI0003483C67|nr:DUF29 domain-containing protein [Synechococcus sp. PCC 7336]
MTGGYDTDFNCWARETARLLREKRWHELDLEHLIEEVEDLGKSERRALSSQLERILIHLLKWQYQPQRRTDSWLDFSNDGRVQIYKILKDSPSLKTFPAIRLAEDYEDARRYAAKQTGLSIEKFPLDCPYSVEQILDDNWLPEA